VDRHLRLLRSTEFQNASSAAYDEFQHRRASTRSFTTFLDATLQISLFGKLKLQNCVRAPGGALDFNWLGRQVYDWAYTDVVEYDFFVMAVRPSVIDRRARNRSSRQSPKQTLSTPHRVQESIE
jgi:hypothetical protein